MKILFICKYNRLRSKIAESLFKYHDNEKKHEVKSAGIRSSILNPYIVPRAKQLLIQRGAIIEDDSSVIVNDYLIKWADKIIIVADDIPKDKFPKEKTLVWSVEDIDDKDDRKVMVKIDEIELKVKELINSLNNNI